MSSISTGTVYKIVCSLDENIIYIGSTYNQLRHRWQQHKDSYKRYLEGKNSCISIYPYFEKFGIENFKIMKIKQYECYREHNKDSKHLHAFEQLWINKTRCVNKNSAFSIPIVAKEKLSEYLKEWREANKEKISEQTKEYNEKNKEKLSEKNKEWKEANKEKINEYRKEYYQANKEKISEQTKEYYQANKEKINEYNKEWREVNREKISEKEKEYREANRNKILEKNKERVKCTICNKDLARASLSRHKKRFHPS